MSNTNHDFIVKNGLVVGSAITSTGTLTQAGQTFPASDGSANQYLKTNGSGALSWGTVSTSFNITDGTTTDTVGLTETVTFTGGTNISLAVTDNTVTITNDVVDSDDITEGSSNLFYTDARAIAAIQGASNLTIDGGTLYVDTAADRVGISDTSPQQKLDVAGNIGVNGSEVIDASGNIVGSVADSAMTVGGSLAGVLSNLKVQYGTSYSGTPIQGSFFFDSLNQKLKVYTGSAFIDAVPAGSGGGGGGGATDANTTFRNYSYTLTGTTSAVSGVDDNELTAGAFIVGHKYTITSVGNTDFTAIGASANTVGVVFTATGVGSGTGQAKSTLFYDTTSSTTRVVAYVNGIKQVYGSGRDFVATTGTSVAFTYNLGSGDTVDIQVYELLTNDAYYLKSEVYTQTEVNSQISTALSGAISPSSATINDINISRITGANDYTQIKKTSTGSNLAITSQESIYLNIDANNDQTNRSVIIATNTDVPGSGTVIAKFQEDGKVGIGTDSPDTKFHVYNSSGNTYAKLESNANNTRSALLPWAKKSDGSTLRGYIGVTGDANKMEIATSTNDSIHFYTNNNPTNNGIFLKADGNVGIGETTPENILHIKTGATGGPQIELESTSGTANSAFINFDGTSLQLSTQRDMVDGSKRDTGKSWGGINIIGAAGGSSVSFTTSPNTNQAATTRMTIDRDGNVGIGATVPTAKLHVEGTFQVRSSSSSIFNDTNNAENVRMLVSGTHFNADGADKDFRVECPGEPYAIFLDSGEQRLFFGNSSVSENSSESIYVDVEPGNRHRFLAGNSREILYINRNGTDGTSLVFRKSNVQVGGVSVTSSGTTYNTTSDRRLKDNIEPISDATDKLMDMKPVTHTWIDNPEAPQVHGFIAQEMQEVIPEAVSGDAESDEMMSMDYGRITPVIVAALQDALNEIKELKTRIDELENK